MQLNSKSLNVLASIKAELLSRNKVEMAPKEEEQSVIITFDRPKKEPKTTTRMRHARVHGRAFQRMCQSGEYGHSLRF